ncbi:MAG TPA: nuclear transport factor 2 family protein [Pyrinomonadaceae bacterium]|nr:nuclear transport factor 2 family protein [Pyrinomonadaceae bacterium]
MKILSILFMLIGIVTAVSAQKTTDKQEKESAKVPLENYLQAQATGNPEFIRKAFYADARIMTFRDGKMTNLSVEEFAGRFNGKTAEDEAKRKRTIESLEISGNAAIAKVVLDYPTVRFTDFMSLLKINGEWKIVNKSFYAEIKEQPKK